MLSDTTLASVISSWAFYFLPSHMNCSSVISLWSQDFLPNVMFSFSSLVSGGSPLSAKQVYCRFCLACSTIGLPAPGLLKGVSWKVIGSHEPLNLLEQILQFSKIRRVTNHMTCSWTVSLFLSSKLRNEFWRKAVKVVPTWF